MGIGVPSHLSMFFLKSVNKIVLTLDSLSRDPAIILKREKKLVEKWQNVMRIEMMV